MKQFWIYFPTGYTTENRKQMKQYLGSAKFDRCLKNGDVRYINFTASSEYDLQSIK